MTESYFLRVAAAALAGGRLAGEVEHVASGERGRVRDAQELLDFVHRTCPAVPTGPPGPHLDPESPCTPWKGSS